MTRPESFREADLWQVRDAFRCFGALWGAEQAEGDDDGATQIETLVKGLRKFAQHEAEEGDDDCGCGCCPCCC